MHQHIDYKPCVITRSLSFTGESGPETRDPGCKNRPCNKSNGQARFQPEVLYLTALLPSVVPTALAVCKEQILTAVASRK